VTNGIISSGITFPFDKRIRANLSSCISKKSEISEQSYESTAYLNPSLNPKRFEDSTGTPCKYGINVILKVEDLIAHQQQRRQIRIIQPARPHQQDFNVDSQAKILLL
jgi:hypothetical protein